MAFDDIQFPLRVGFGSSGGPAFSTEIVTIDGGYERRNQNWSQARRHFDAATGLRTANDVATLIAFFHARARRARGFRVKDWSDYTSSADGISASNYNDQAIGVGTGSLTQFQLKKNYISAGVTHARDIRKPVAGSVTIGVNGTQASTGWSADTTTGIVTFATAPISGATISAGFSFDVPVRFDTDQLRLSAEDFQRYTSSIPLVEVRV